jgi:hypothetical protein
MSLTPSFTSLAAKVAPGELSLERKASAGGKRLHRKFSRQASGLSDDSMGRKSVYDPGDMGGVSKRVSALTLFKQQHKGKKGPSLMFQAITTPGKMHMREIDPRRVAFQEKRGFVKDWRRNRWEGAGRLIDCVRPEDQSDEAETCSPCDLAHEASRKKVQYTMKLTGFPRASIVPENNSELSSDDEEMMSDSEEGDAVVNSDSEDQSAYSGKGSSSLTSSANNSTTTGGHIGGESLSISGMSKEMANMSRRRNKIKERITGWLSQYSGCSRGHGERLLKKIYKPVCDEAKVHVNSGVRLLLMTTPPCFCSLQTVNLRNYLLGNRGVQALWPLLKYARALKSLNLTGNDIHDTGAMHVVSVLEADAQNQGKDDLGGLLVVDLSQNPITGGMFEGIWHFNETRKDILMLGLADTMMPSVKRQRILRQCLQKFASAEHGKSFEAWRLCRDPLDFSDRELFVQIERVVEATHGSAIHDLEDAIERSRNGHKGWMDDDNWEENDELQSLPSLGDLPKDGFLGLDDVPSPRISLSGQSSPRPMSPPDIPARPISPPDIPGSAGNDFDVDFDDENADAASVGVHVPTSARETPTSRRGSLDNPYAWERSTPVSASARNTSVSMENPYAPGLVDLPRSSSSSRSWALRRRKGTVAQSTDLGAPSTLRTASELTGNKHLGAKRERAQRMTIFHRKKSTEG